MSANGHTGIPRSEAGTEKHHKSTVLEATCRIAMLLQDQAVQVDKAYFPTPDAFKHPS
jgi:hypothetical protein